MVTFQPSTFGGHVVPYPFAEPLFLPVWYPIRSTPTAPKHLMRLCSCSSQNLLHSSAAAPCSTGTNLMMTSLTQLPSTKWRTTFETGCSCLSVNFQIISVTMKKRARQQLPKTCCPMPALSNGTTKTMNASSVSHANSFGWLTTAKLPMLLLKCCWPTSNIITRPSRQPKMSCTRPPTAISMLMMSQPKKLHCTMPSKPFSTKCHVCSIPLPVEGPFPSKLHASAVEAMATTSTPWHTSSRKAA